MKTSAEKQLGEYADWKAPRVDGSVLLWPGGDLVELARRNAEELGQCEQLISGVPLREWRASVRRFLGVAESELLFVTGHQAELHHPGVWVKNVVVDALSRRVDGGRAMHLAVDTDQPKHLVLRLPTRDRGALGEALTDDASDAAWAGRLSGPSPVHAADLERLLARESGEWGFEPVAGEFLAEMRRLSLEGGELPKMLTSALHRADWGLGLRYDAVLASLLWESEGFLLLCCEVMRRAREYARAYNAALAAYREEEGIDDPGRPMPDLMVTEDEVELPLWFDDLASGQRERLRVRVESGRTGLRVRGHEVDVDSGWDGAAALLRLMRREGLRISPRALMLTTFMRLGAADLFVHGIGGGRYDQVTDRTLGSFFGLGTSGAARFAVATGTLYFPWALGRTKACVPCVAQEGHRIRHSVLGDRKRSFLERMAVLPRRSGERKQVFLSMQAELRALWASAPELSLWAERMEETVRAAAEDAVVFDRELFYCLQPRDRLTAWIEKVREEIGSRS
jgi:hypothetical protein